MREGKPIDWKQYVRQRLPALGLSGAREQEIVEELAQQLDGAYSEALARGESVAEAEGRAAAQIPNWASLALEIRRAEQPLAEKIAATVPENWREAMREENLRKRRGGNMFADLFQDVQYALRMLRKSPGFAALVVLTLALGIGANSTIFSVINGVLLRPLPYSEPEQLVRVLESNPRKGWPTFSVSPPNFLDWRAQAHSFAGLAATENNAYTYTGGDVPERWTGPQVTEGFFETLRVQPELGRLFIPDEFQAGKNHVVVISDALWHSAFAGDPAAIGRSVSLDGQSYTVIGVMGPSFRFPNPATQVWAPLAFSPNELQNARGAHFLGDIARLGPGVSVAQAQSEMAAIAERLEKQYPVSNSGWTVAIVPLSEGGGVAQIRPALLVLLGAVGFVLLIACANAANMLLARATVRHREIAIRLALGAGRARVVRQLLTESVVLSFAGAALGLLIAFWSTRVIAALPPRFLPRAQMVSVDGRVLFFTLALALVTGILFGLAPALTLGREDLAGALKDGGRAGAARGGLRKLLVVAEVMLAFVLLSGAGLLVRSFTHLTSVDLGLQTAGRYAFDLSAPQTRYPTPQKQLEFFNQVQQRVAALPGVDSSALVSLIPISGDDEMYEVALAGQPSSESNPSALSYRVTPGFLRTMGIRLLAGRDFTTADDLTAPHVCIINDVFARAMFPGRDPIGQKIQFGHQFNIVREIVGVAGYVNQYGPAEEKSLQVYEPFAQFPRTDMSVILRTSGSGAGLAAAARVAVREVDPQQAVIGFRSFDELVSESVSLPRFRTVLLGLFAGLAALLAAAGLYGVMSYTVTQQTQEIGIRMALGAQPSQILRLIVSRGMGLVAAGVALGLAGALILTRVMQSFTAFLFGVKPNDPVTLVGVTILFALVAATACWLPAWRASRVDPLVALRYE
ncbi:MAG TPA: ABC transporter permease [Candidatus Acidoferrales bacterium]|nr:ABC transporter permease [Candidatus Acidoferrales bacterium]